MTQALQIATTVFAHPDPYPQRLVVLDLETTGVDTKTAQVVQWAWISAARMDGVREVSDSDLCDPGIPIPSEATAVHGISDADVDGFPHFREFSGWIREETDDVMIVTFNGHAFDLPIMRRILEIPLDGPHFDVYRVWQHARRQNLLPSTVTPRVLSLPRPGASRFTGALGSAWAWLSGFEPDGTHDALRDCELTLDVARKLLSVYGITKCLAWSSGLLPGDLDFEGKFSWHDTKGAVFSFGKHKGKPIASERGYLSWMLGKDFHEDTKRIARKALDGATLTR